MEEGKDGVDEECGGVVGGGVVEVGVGEDALGWVGMGWVVGLVSTESRSGVVGRGGEGGRREWTDVFWVVEV